LFSYETNTIYKLLLKRSVCF